MALFLPWKQKLSLDFTSPANYRPRFLLSITVNTNTEVPVPTCVLSLPIFILIKFLTPQLHGNSSYSYSCCLHDFIITKSKSQFSILIIFEQSAAFNIFDHLSWLPKLHSSLTSPHSPGTSFSLCASFSSAHQLLNNGVTQHLIPEPCLFFSLHPLLGNSIQALEYCFDADDSKFNLRPTAPHLSTSNGYSVLLHACLISISSIKYHNWIP